MAGQVRECEVVVVGAGCSASPPTRTRLLLAWHAGPPGRGADRAADPGQTFRWVRSRRRRAWRARASATSSSTTARNGQALGLPQHGEHGDGGEAGHGVHLVDHDLVVVLEEEVDPGQPLHPQGPVGGRRQALRVGQLRVRQVGRARWSRPCPARTCRRSRRTPGWR